MVYHAHVSSALIENRRTEGNYLFNDATSTFYLWLFGVGLIFKRDKNLCQYLKKATLSDLQQGVFYMYQPIDMSYSFRLAAASDRQDGAYHDPCYMICGVLHSTMNSFMRAPMENHGTSIGRPATDQSRSESCIKPLYCLSALTLMVKLFLLVLCVLNTSLTIHSTHLRLYGVGHMVKDHSDIERGNPLQPGPALS